MPKSKLLILGYLSRATEYKGYMIMYDAVLKLQKKGITVIWLMIAGADHKKVIDDLKGCDYLVIPSMHKEAMGRGFFDAKKAGIRVIASDVGAHSEMVKRYGGYLFNPGDVDSLVRVILDICEVELERKL